MPDDRGLFLKYFVLSPTKRGVCGEASREACMAYAQVIERTNPVLAFELSNWIRQIEAELQVEVKDDAACAE